MEWYWWNGLAGMVLEKGVPGMVLLGWSCQNGDNGMVLLEKRNSYDGMYPPTQFHQNIQHTVFDKRHANDKIPPKSILYFINQIL